MKFHHRLIPWLLLIVWFEATAIDATPGVRVTQLAKETTSWDGKPIVYPDGQAEVTALLVEIGPGGQSGWHNHAVPSFAYVLEGTLEVTLDDGRVKRVEPGEAFAEVANRDHNGRTPVKLVVFYAGVTGTPLSVKQER